MLRKEERRKQVFVSPSFLNKDALPQQRYLLKIQLLARAPAAAEGFSQRYAAKAAYREDIPLVGRHPPLTNRRKEAFVLRYKSVEINPHNSIKCADFVPHISEVPVS